MPPRTVQPVFRIQQKLALRMNQADFFIIRVIVHLDSKGAEQTAPSHNKTAILSTTGTHEVLSAGRPRH